jgi:hypothetical protein
MLTGLAIVLWLVAVIAEGIRDLLIGLTTLYDVASGKKQGISPIGAFWPPILMWVLIAAIATGLLVAGIKVGSWVLVIAIIAFGIWSVIAIDGIRQGWRTSNQAKDEFVLAKQTKAS